MINQCAHCGFFIWNPDATMYSHSYCDNCVKASLGVPKDHEAISTLAQAASYFYHKGRKYYDQAYPDRHQLADMLINAIINSGYDIESYARKYAEEFSQSNS